MRLEYNCTSCRNSNYFKPVIATRGDLQMKVGDEVQVICKYCGEPEKKHLNKITAVVDKRILLVGFVLSVILAIVLWKLYGAIGVVTITLPALIGAYESNAVNNFNKYRIRK